MSSFGALEDSSCMCPYCNSVFKGMGACPTCNRYPEEEVRNTHIDLGTCELKAIDERKEPNKWLRL